MKCVKCNQEINERLKLCAEYKSDFSAGAVNTATCEPESIFVEADRIIHGQRRKDYGPVEESFHNIATVWSGILGQFVTDREVALCMIGLKCCREANNHTRDSLVDICGYAGLIEELEK
jgi:hypothetical protein